MMRFPMSGLIVVSGLFAAGVASAQMMPMMSPMPPVSASYGGNIDGPSFPSQRERYVTKIVELRAKVVHLTAADGGQLTPEHKASLQIELDGLNHKFGIKPAHG